MINFTEVLKPFENNNCGGYHEYITDDYGSELQIDDVIIKAFEDEGISEFLIKSTVGEDSPGFSLTVLSVAYVSRQAGLMLVTIELTTC